MKNIVYLLNLEDSDLYKIGITDENKIEKRIKSLQTGAPKKLNVITLFKTNFATIIEKKLHMFFEPKKSKGEWFTLTDEDIQLFENKCKNLNDNINFLIENNNEFIIKRVNNGKSI